MVIILMTIKPASLNRDTIRPTLDLKNKINNRTTTQITWERGFKLAYYYNLL